VAVSPEGKQLLSGSFDGTMRLWDIATGKELKRFDGEGHFVETVAFTKDGKRALCSYGSKGIKAIYKLDSSCTMRLWDLASGKELKRFEGHAGPVLSMAVSADGRFILSGSNDNTMRLWQMPQ
jgi:WD40 repeat protein